jgi:hypothetical protein
MTDVTLCSQDAVHGKTEVDSFYQDSSSSLDLLLEQRENLPTQIVLFGALHRAQAPGTRVKELYEIVYSNGWNGFDNLQDDGRRRGGILVLEYTGPQG